MVRRHLVRPSLSSSANAAGIIQAESEATPPQSQYHVAGYW